MTVHSLHAAFRYHFRAGSLHRRSLCIDSCPFLAPFSPEVAHKEMQQTVIKHSSSGATCRARPLPGDLLDWHFVLLGGNGTSFEGGMYHGRIMLDNEYPMKPPRIFFYTESGRFETGVAICAIPLHTHAPHRRCDAFSSSSCDAAFARNRVGKSACTLWQSHTCFPGISTHSSHPRHPQAFR